MESPNRARSRIARCYAKAVVGGTAVLKQIESEKLAGPGPLQPGIDVDGRDGESFGVPGVGHDLAVGRDDAAVAVVVRRAGRDRPVDLIGADQPQLIGQGAGAAEEVVGVAVVVGFGVVTLHRPGGGQGRDLGAFEGELPRDLGEGQVVADEHADLAERSWEDIEVVAGAEDRPLELVVELAEDPEHARSVDEDRAVVDDVPVHRQFGHARLDQHPMPFGEQLQLPRRRPGDRLGRGPEVVDLLVHLGRAKPAGAEKVALQRDLGEDEVTDALEGSLLDEPLVLGPVRGNIMAAVHRHRRDRRLLWSRSVEGEHGLNLSG